MDSSKHKCRYCERTYTRLSNRRAHERITHKIIKKITTFDCEVCRSTFKTKQKLNLHISEIHQNLRGKEELQFNSMPEFELWKKNIEKFELSSYVVTSSYKATNSSVKLYSCHRSGHYKSHGNGIRRLKTLGSNKIGSICPASIKLSHDSLSGVITVTHYPTHMGHGFEAERLRANKSENKKKAGQQLCAGVDDITYTAPVAIATGATTIALDEMDISVSYEVETVPASSPDDLMSVDCWVKEMTTTDDNPILLYKFPGDIDEQFPGLELCDFVLGFMNDAQREIFKLYGHEVVSVYSTHSTNQYNIQLTSIIVKDDKGEGFPVAFMWSNSQQEDAFRYFLEKCKMQIGNLKVRALITDDCPALYDSWSSVFGPPTHSLLCDWHVRRVWNNKLCSGTTLVRNYAKRREVLNCLHTLSTEADEMTFTSLLNAIKTHLLKDEDTAAFGTYFVSNYCDRTRQWAACYRSGVNIDPDMAVKRWHKDLKYNSDLQGKCSDQLDKAVHSLIEALRMKLINRLSSLPREKLAKEISAIRKAHEIAEENQENFTITNEGDDWLISSLSQSGVIYKIKKLQLDNNHKCNLTCDSCKVCLHHFVCSCPNNSVQYNMCKHIHGLALRENLIPNEVEICPTSDNVDAQVTAKAKEKKAVSNSVEIYKSTDLSKLKQLAVSKAMSLVQEVKSFSNLEQCRQLIRLVALTKNKCRSLAGVSSKKHFPAAGTNELGSKLRELQRTSPPAKKQRDQLELRRPTVPIPIRPRILTSNPIIIFTLAENENSDDHNYCIAK